MAGKNYGPQDTVECKRRSRVPENDIQVGSQVFAQGKFDHE